MVKKHTKNRIEIVVFLGNPGKQYEKTRHNAAWLLLNYFTCNEPPNWQRKFKGEYAVCTIGQKAVYLLKPLTFMNKSGDSIVAITRFFKIPVSRCLLVHDDVELDYGWIALRRGGGLAGHNGLRSAEKIFGSRDFFRLRLGVGRPDHGAVSSHVLGRFADRELSHLGDILKPSADVLTAAIISDDADAVAKKYATVSCKKSQ